jgi:DNA segregation ATPase FtsK/SpoIIIE-like protein
VKNPVTPKQIAAAETTLRRGTWGITAGAVLYSVLTVTPLVARVTPDGWEATAPILPLVVDTAVIVSVKLDATVSRLGERSGGWATLLRWMTGLMTLGLNVGDSALKRDWVGVAVHAVIPLILIVIADAGLAWRRSINRAVDRLEREQAEAEQRSRAAEQARREQERAEQLEAEERSRQEQERAREHAERLERERLEREDQRRREEREHALLLEQQRAEREAAERREQREAQQARQLAELEQRARAEREQREREAAEQAARERAVAERRAAREQRERAAMNTDTPAVNTEGPAVNPVNKVSEADARAAVAAAVNTGATIRELADATGWSVGWISARRQELALAESGK